MRIILSVAAIATAAAPATAGSLTRLDDGAIPPQCRIFARAPAPTPQLQLEARISIATCMVGVQLDGIQRTIKKPTAGLEALGDAASPAIYMLDDVIAQGDPTTTILAQHAKGDIYAALAVRLRTTVPPMTSAATETDRLQLDAMHAAIEPAVKPWLDAADRAFNDAIATAEQHPELHPNAVVAHAVELSTEALDDTHAIVGQR